MHWADNTVTASARYNVACVVISIYQNDELDEQKQLEYILEYISEKVTSMSRWPSRSTSAMSNYALREELSAWGELQSIVAGYQRYRQSKKES